MKLTTSEIQEVTQEIFAHNSYSFISKTDFDEFFPTLNGVVGFRFEGETVEEVAAQIKAEILEGYSFQKLMVFFVAQSMRMSDMHMLNSLFGRLQRSRFEMINNANLSYGRITVFAFGGAFTNEKTLITIRGEEYLLDEYGNRYRPDGKILVKGANVRNNRVMDGCEIISNGAFDDHEDMEDIFLPESVKEIGEYAFSCCFGLKSFTFPKNLKKIGSSAFVSCNIKSFDIPESVSSLGEEAFGFCNDLEEFTGKFATPDGRFLIQHGVLMSYAPSGTHRAIVPDGVLVLGARAFSGCPDLQEVVLPRSLVSICDCAFNHCRNLKKIYVPSSLKAAARNAIWQCWPSVIEI